MIKITPLMSGNSVTTPSNVDMTTGGESYTLVVSMTSATCVLLSGLVTKRTDALALPTLEDARPRR